MNSSSSLHSPRGLVSLLGGSGGSRAHFNRNLGWRLFPTSQAFSPTLFPGIQEGKERWQEGKVEFKNQGLPPTSP